MTVNDRSRSAFASATSSSLAICSACVRCDLSSATLASAVWIAASLAFTCARAESRAASAASSVALEVKSRSTRAFRPREVGLSLRHERALASVELGAGLRRGRLGGADLRAEGGDGRLSASRAWLSPDRRRACSRHRRGGRASSPAFTCWFSTIGTSATLAATLGDDDRHVGADVGVVGRDDEAADGHVVVGVPGCGREGDGRRRKTARLQLSRTGRLETAASPGFPVAVHRGSGLAPAGDGRVPCEVRQPETCRRGPSGSRAWTGLDNEGRWTWPPWTSSYTPKKVELNRTVQFHC